MIFKTELDLMVAVSKSILLQVEGGVKSPVYKDMYGELVDIRYINIGMLTIERFFPICVIDETPIFEGDVVYHKCGYRYKVQEIETHSDGRIAFRTVHAPWNDGDFITEYTIKDPRPNTVMIEILRTDAEYIAGFWDKSQNVSCRFVAEACKKVIK